MTIEFYRNRINDELTELNRLNGELKFSLLETKFSVELVCASVFEPEQKFSEFGCIVFLPDYVRPVSAYETVMGFIRMLKAASGIKAFKSGAYAA